MKRIITVALLLVITTTIVFVSCVKESSDVTPTVTTCKDSVYIMSDSMTCSGKKFFYLLKNNKLVTYNPGITALDTITHTAVYFINYDSVGTTQCGGATFTLANITCYQKK